MTRLAEKVVLVTGAASGIGQAAAQRCAAEGARVVRYDIAAEALAETAAHIGAEQALPVAVDLAEPVAVDTAVAQAVACWGRLDGVFNVAGGSGRRRGDGPVDQRMVEGGAGRSGTTKVIVSFGGAQPHSSATR